MQDGEAALFYAASAGKVEVVDLLLERGADVKHHDRVSESSTNCIPLDYHFVTDSNKTHGDVYVYFCTVRRFSSQ